MIMEWLLNFLTKSTKTPEELHNIYEQRATMLLELVCQYVQGEWLTMSGREPIPDPIRSQIETTGWLPNERTWNSWKQVYEVGKFFQVRIVPLNILIENRSSDTERYSGYTKGYGNGGHRSSTVKTSYNYELDGETTDREPAEIPLADFEMYNQLQFLIIKEKIRKRNR
jgi:hypothetical protein